MQKICSLQVLVVVHLWVQSEKKVKSQKKKENNKEGSKEEKEESCWDENRDKL